MLEILPKVPLLPVREVHIVEGMVCDINPFLDNQLVEESIVYFTPPCFVIRMNNNGIGVRGKDFLWEEEEEERDDGGGQAKDNSFLLCSLFFFFE
jgi:hypothetical protein